MMLPEVDEYWKNAIHFNRQPHILKYLLII
jgi:hypothetical protein